MDEILREICQLRREQATLNSYSREVRRHLIQYPESYPARLIATSLPMEAEYIKSELKRQLQEDQDVLDDVASGRKHLLETVKVNTMKEFADEMNRRILAELLSPVPTEQALVAAMQEEGKATTAEEGKTTTAEEGKADTAEEDEGNDDVHDEGKEQGVVYPQGHRRRTV